MANKGVCRTAPASPDLLNMIRWGKYAILSGLLLLLKGVTKNLSSFIKEKSVCTYYKFIMMMKRRTQHLNIHHKSICLLYSLVSTFEAQVTWVVFICPPVDPLALLNLGGPMGVKAGMYVWKMMDGFLGL